MARAKQDPKHNPAAAKEDLVGKTLGGVEIISLDAPRVSGGMTREEAQAAAFGPMRTVKVRELDNPNGRDVQVVAMHCRRGAYEKVFRSGVPVNLPDAAIEVLEGAKVQHERAIPVGSGLIGNPDHAEKYNPGLQYQVTPTGPVLVSSEDRFEVRTIAERQERLVVRA